MRWWLLAGQSLAFWPVWAWYVRKTADPSAEPWGLLALGTAAVFMYLWGPGQVTRGVLGLVAGLVALYAASYLFIPPGMAAVLAVTAVGLTLVGTKKEDQGGLLGLWGLLVLCLPLSSSLQFYLGFPVRAATAELAAPLLRAGGLAVEVQGLALRWGGQTVLIDAPCSGVKMLWSGAYLACSLACLYRLTWRRTVLTGLVTAAAVFLGNVLRSASLFYVEAGIVPAPQWAHAAVGVVVFAMIAIAVAAVVRWLHRGGRPCAA